MKKSPAKRAGETIAGVVVQGARITGRTLRQPAQPEPVARRRFWGWAILIAVGWHVAWATWLVQATVPGRSFTPPRMSVTFLPELTRDDDSQPGHGELLRVWSPSLFALPTEMGFSGGLPQEERGIKPPLDALKESSLFVRRQPSTGEPKDRSRLAEKIAAERSRLEGPPAAGVAEMVFSVNPSRAAAGTLHATFLDGLEELGAKTLDPPPAPPDSLKATWVAEAQLHLDEHGVVSHVFLVQRTPAAELDQHLVAQLLAMRFEPATTKRTGLVRIRAGQAPVAAEAMP